MAERPVFLPAADGKGFVRTKSVAFQFFSGFAPSQKQKSVDSLHAAARRQLGVEEILEVSRRSRENCGVALSAFNLTFRSPVHPEPISVECAFQGSKVFAGGGPFIDLYGATSKEAKTDERLKNSGNLAAFRYDGKDWPLEPKTAFYDWLYISALKNQPALAQEVLRYSAFTDIEFNPERSINCQAYSVALFVALDRRGLVGEATQSPESFLAKLGGSFKPAK